MRNINRTLFVVTTASLLGGCLAKAAVDVVTLPVRAGSQAVDWATTSQDEADRNQGRRDRKAREKAAKEERKAAKDAERAARRRDD